MCSVPPYTWYRHYGSRRVLSDQVEDAHFFPPIFPYNSTSIFGWEQIFLVNIVLSWIAGHLYISIVVTCGDSFSKRVLDWAINPSVWDSMLEGMPISPGIKEYPQQREKAKANTHEPSPSPKGCISYCILGYYDDFHYLFIEMWQRKQTWFQVESIPLVLTLEFCCLYLVMMVRTFVKKCWL